MEHLVLTIKFNNRNLTKKLKNNNITGKILEGDIICCLGLNYNKALTNQIFQQWFKSPLEEIDNVYYLESPLEGISLVLSSNFKITTIQLYSAGIYEYCEYRGNIPGGVTFKMSQDDIHNLLGEPSENKGKQIDFLLGLMNPWDKYKYDNAWLHFEYFDDLSKIKLITINLPE